jgi:hypothetical protein
MKIGQPKLFERVKRRLVVTPTNACASVIPKSKDYGSKVSIKEFYNLRIQHATENLMYVFRVRLMLLLSLAVLLSFYKINYQV